MRISNMIYLSPVINLVCPSARPTKCCITFAFHFFWELQWSQEKIKTMVMYNSEGNQGKVYYGRCANGEYHCLLAFLNGTETLFTLC